jgi:ABC-2 type transport system permease protein
MNRVGVAWQMGLREYRRTTILLEILIAAPADVIVLLSLVVPTANATFRIASGATITASYAGVVGTLMTPVAGAIIGGVTGMFVMRSTRETDERLVIAGYRPYQVILARLGMLGSIGVLVTLVSLGALLAMGVLVTGFSPALLGWFALATLLAVLVYGMVGVLAGSVLDTLPGIYLLLFIPTIDLMLFQNPLAHDRPAAATYLPGHFPMELAIDAALTGTVEIETVVWSLVMLTVLLVLATAAFYRSLRVSE